jgi:predicted RND superfamily exporter protein
MDQSGAIGVITWVASPIKLQADMGLLLAFMLKASVQLTGETA